MHLVIERVPGAHKEEDAAVLAVVKHFKIKTWDQIAMSTQTITAVGQAQEAQSQYPREPLQLKGALDQYKSFDVTPVIGREFVDVNLKEWLRAPNSDDLIRDLAITSMYPNNLKRETRANVLDSFTARSRVLPKAGRSRQQPTKRIS